MPVLTRAGVFGVGAGRALVQIEIELLSDRLGLRIGLDLHHSGQVVAFRDDFVGDQFVAILGEGQFGGRAAVAHCHSDDLPGRSNHLAGIIHEPNFDLLVFGDEEFGMWFHLGDELAAGRASLAPVLVIMFIGGSYCEGESEREESCKQFGFHWIAVCRVLDVVWVLPKMQKL